jgi:hypothetical protein
MITDPKTVPDGRRARLAYSCSIAVVAAALVAPAQTEFGAKLGVLAALAIVCPMRPLLERLLPDRPGRPQWRFAAASAAAVAAGLAAIAAPAPGIAGPSAAADQPLPSPPTPRFAIAPNDDVPARISAAQGRAMARDVAVALAVQQRALERRDRTALAGAAAVAWRATLEARLAHSGRSGPLQVARYRLTRLTLTLARRPGQGPPAIMAVLHGGVAFATWAGDPLRQTSVTAERPLLKAFEIAKVGARYRIVSDVVPVGWRPS